jgi:hypothetical protein
MFRKGRGELAKYHMNCKSNVNIIYCFKLQQRNKMCSFNLCTLLTKTAVTNYMQVVKTYGQDCAKSLHNGERKALKNVLVKLLLF